jgi:GT2 family glycosyltransferase
MDAATGDVICRIDVDTCLPPSWIEQIHDLFSDREVGAVTGPARYYDIRLPGLVARLDLLLRAEWARAERQWLDWVNGANMAVRSSAWRSVRGTLCEDSDVHEDVDLGIHLFHAGHRVIFVPGLTAGTSSRRIRDSLHEFAAYLRMTERCYATHAALAGRNSYRRAWVTNRIILACYFPLRFLHYSHLSNSIYPLPRGQRNDVAVRKNPMSGA